MISLLAHSRFRRVRFHKVQGTNSPLDPRLEAYWEERRTQSLYRRALADARQLQALPSLQATKLPVRHHRTAVGGSGVGGHPPHHAQAGGWQRRLGEPLPGAAVVKRNASALHARHGRDYSGLR